MEPPTENYTRDRQAMKVRLLFAKAESSLPHTPDQPPPAPLGSGDFCITFLVHSETGTPAVAKVLLPTNNTLKSHTPEVIAGQFAREAELMKTSSHSAVPRLFSTSEIALSSGIVTPVIIREFFPQSAHNFMHSLPQNEKVSHINSMTGQVASGLDYLRTDQHTMTTDIHPGNIYRRSDGSYAIADLGMTVDSVTHEGLLGVNNYYSPPEICQSSDTVEDHIKNATPQAQVYSLAAVALDLLGGNLLSPADLSMGGKYEITDVPAIVPPDARAVLVKALSKESRDRYPTPADFAQAFSSSLSPSQPSL